MRGGAVMARKGREFEKAYEWLYSLDERFTVISPAFLYDKAAEEKREVDVLVEYTDAKGLPRKICIECRDRGKPQDVMWIEQLQQKREDLGLDYIIATTTSSFTAGAIRKAKYHGVIIEQAEMLSKKTVDDNAQSFFFDAFFFKFELLEMNLYTLSNGKMSLKDYLKRLNILERGAVLKEINTDFYFSIDPGKIIEENDIKVSDFFTKEDSSMDIQGNDILDASKKAKAFSDVMALEWKIHVIPYRVTLPLTDSISVFDGEEHTNKDYRATYGSEDEYFKIGYLDGKLFTDIKFKPRKYLRAASGSIGLNTIIPETVDSSAAINMDYIVQNLTGEFDMSKLDL